MCTLIALRELSDFLLMLLFKFKRNFQTVFQTGCPVLQSQGKKGDLLFCIIASSCCYQIFDFFVCLDFCPFLIGLLVCLVLHLNDLFYNSLRSPFPDMCFENIFSVYDISFHYLKSISHRGNFYVNKAYHQFFHWFTVFGVICKNSMSKVMLIGSFVIF